MLRLRPLVFGAVSTLALSAAVAAQPGSGPLFPESFRVTHHLVQDDGDGSLFVGEPVVDTYGGSWIVSERPDGSRLIVDLVRRELTEVRADKGTYWTVSFDRFAELQKRMQTAQVTRTPRKAADTPEKTAATSESELVVTEVPAGETERGLRQGNAANAGNTASVADKPGVRRLRVSLKGGSSDAAFEVWVDPSVRLAPAALNAIGGFEAALSDKSAAMAPGRALAAARAYASGALPVRTVRAMSAGGMGRVEDAATKVERLERFPSELAEIPEGLTRVPHPLEAAVRFLEEDAERNLVMSGARREGNQQP
jgi:hypothetical protein